MRLFNRRSSSSKTNDEEPNKGLSVILNRPRAVSTNSQPPKLSPSQQKFAAHDNPVPIIRHSPSNYSPSIGVPSERNHHFGPSSFDSATPSTSHTLPPPPLSPNPLHLTRTAHWFDKENQQKEQSMPMGESNLEILSSGEHEQSWIGGRNASRRSSVSSVASNGLSRIFKGSTSTQSNSISTPQPPSTLHKSSPILCPSNNSRQDDQWSSNQNPSGSSPPTIYKTSPDYNHHRSTSSILASFPGRRSKEDSPSISQVTAFQTEQELPSSPKSSMFSQLRSRSRRPGTSEGAGARNEIRAPTSPPLPSSPSRGRRSIDSGRFESPTTYPLPSPALTSLAERLTGKDSGLDFEGRLSLVLDWATKPNSTLRQEGKEKNGLGKRISPWQSKKGGPEVSSSKFTSLIEEMESLETHLSDVILKRIKDGNADKQAIEEMRLTSIFREARRCTGLPSKSSYRVFPVVEENLAILASIHQSFDLNTSRSSSSPSSPKISTQHRQAASPTPIKAPPPLNPTMVFDAPLSSSTSSTIPLSSKNLAFEVPSLTPAPRRKKRPKTAPDGERKSFGELPPSPHFNKEQVIKIQAVSSRLRDSSIEDSRSSRESQIGASKTILTSSSYGSSQYSTFSMQNGVQSSYRISRFSDDSFGNRSESPSSSTSHSKAMGLPVRDSNDLVNDLKLENDSEIVRRRIEDDFSQSVFFER